MHHPKLKALKAKAQIPKDPHAVPTEARCLYLKRMHAMAGMQREVIQKWPSAYDHLAAGTLCFSMNTGRFEVRGLCFIQGCMGGNGKEMETTVFFRVKVLRLSAFWWFLT